VRPIVALKARVWIAQGRLGDALGWVREQHLSVDDELGYLHEFEHITLARLLLARATSDNADHTLLEAMGFLERLLHAAEARERIGSVIEILLLQALAHQTHGDIPAALASLERALTLAEPEGYVRIFVDEGAPMAVLLQAALAGGIMPSYVETLLAAVPTHDQRRAVHDQAVTPSPPHPVTLSLVEPLSVRERDVLRLLRTELSGPEIARELMVSLNTLRTHTKNIYDKLGVSNRRAAVRRAEERDLF
jgi:LuxR family maltose regulon positive regulatory protein